MITLLLFLKNVFIPFFEERANITHTHRHMFETHAHINKTQIKQRDLTNQEMHVKVKEKQKLARMTETVLKVLNNLAIVM